MHVRRVNTTNKALEVLDTRYEAGTKYGTGYKPQPKSETGIRVVPLAPIAAEAVERQLPADPARTRWPSPALAAATASSAGRGAPR